MSARGWLVPALSLTACGLLLPVAGSAQSRSVLDLLPTENRRLELGGEHRGALSASDYLSTDDSFLEAWELEGRPGESVTIDLESDDFDARLYVVGPGLAETLTDDDGGGGCDSRLTFTFLEAGSFRVVASSLGARQTGTYLLRVSDRPGAAPTHECGQADPAELTALPTQGRTLRMGSRETSRLLPLSATIQDGRPAEAWTLEGRAGDRVSVTVQADDFDAYLYVLGPGLDGVRTDDDSAGELNPKIDLTLPADGPYTVVAAGLAAGVSGSYVISVGEPLDLATLPTDGRTIDVGQTSEGFLSADDPVVVEGRQGQAWAFDGAAGRSVDIELLATEFDPFLYLAGPGLMEPLSDDDGAGDLNARISVTLPESGSYRIIVSALGAGSRGAFTLRVRSR